MHNKCCVLCVVLLCVGCWVLGVVVGFWTLRFPRCAGPPGAGPPHAPKFRPFFLLSTPFSLFCLSLGCLLVEFWWCSRRPGPSNVPVWALGLLRETQAAERDPGASKHHQNSTRRHPERDKKSENGSGRRKKARNFGGPPYGGPTMTHTRSRNGLAQNGLVKIGLAPIGQIRMAKTGLANFLWGGLELSPWPKVLALL